MRPRYQKPHVYLRNGKAYTRFREDVLGPDGSLHRVHRCVTLGDLAKKFDGRKKAALRAAEQELSRRGLNSTTFQAQATMTLRQFWDEYFVPEILPTLKHSTHKMYGSLMAKHLLPYFGKHKLAEINAVQVQRFIVQKHGPVRKNGAGYSTQTLGHLRDVLSKIFETARLWGMLHANPARGIKLPPAKPVRKTRVLSLEDVHRLVEALREPVRTIFFLGVSLGLRIGELLALRLEDVDLERARLYVRRDVYRGHLQSPKTRASEREFELSQLHVQWLRNYLLHRQVQSEWLFPSAAGTMLDDRDLLRHGLGPVSKALGIAHFGWHALRHTFATIADNHGVPVSVTQSLLGHTSLDTTMVYTHALRDAKREAVRKVTGVLFSDVLNLDAAQGEPKTLLQ